MEKKDKIMPTSDSNSSINMIIHYSEVGLKGKNRSFFENKLRQNIKLALQDMGSLKVRNDYGRFILELTESENLPRVIERLKKVIGIAYFYIAYPGNADIEILKEQILEHIKEFQFKSFKIQTRRSDKQYPLTSVEVNRIVGARIVEALNKKVDLSAPDLTCMIEIFNKKIFYSFKKIQAIRGLPVGSSGKVVSLLSSGIDSPVAAYRMMTRGCRVIFIHFHSFPFTEKTSYYNAQILAKKLTTFQNKSLIYFVPLAKIQEAIILGVPSKFRIIMYRRMMYRIAELIARKENAKALVTGESVGQVASQTLENIIAISEVVTLPVLRPLIGSDKEEIIKQAQKLGTFKTSIEPYDDCCSYLLPKSPETRAKLDEVHSAETRIENREELVQEALRDAEIEIFRFPDDNATNGVE